jgi:hypothetical protein
MDSSYMRKIFNEMIMAKEAIEVGIENYHNSIYPVIDDLENAEEHLETAINKLAILMGIVRDE